MQNVVGASTSQKEEALNCLCFAHKCLQTTLSRALQTSNHAFRKLVCKILQDLRTRESQARLALRTDLGRDDPSHHQLRRLNEVGAPTAEISLPHMQCPSVASLKARSCHGCPAIVAEHGINTRIVIFFYDPHIEYHWSLVSDIPGPARLGWPRLVANVCATD